MIIFQINGYIWYFNLEEKLQERYKYENKNMISGGIFQENKSAYEHIIIIREVAVNVNFQLRYSTLITSLKIKLPPPN